MRVSLDDALPVKLRICPTSPARDEGRNASRMLDLAYGLTFTDLYSVDGAQRIDERFVAELNAADAALGARFAQARAAPGTLGAKEESALLIDVARHVEDFL